MALQLLHNHKGVEFEHAYFKVNYVKQETDGLLAFVAEIFPNETLREQNRCMLDTYVNRAPDEPNDADKNRVIYNWLKTQPGFENAIDV